MSTISTAVQNLEKSIHGGFGQRGEIKPTFFISTPCLRNLPKNCNIFATVWPRSTKFGTVVLLGLPDPWANKILQIRKSKMVVAAILKNYNISATDWPILCKQPPLWGISNVHWSLSSTTWRVAVVVVVVDWLTVSSVLSTLRMVKQTRCATSWRERLEPCRRSHATTR